MAANPEHWQTGPPKVQKLVFRFLPWESQVPVLLNRQVDLITELPGTVATKITQAPYCRILKQKTYWTVGASSNINRSPLSSLLFSGVSRLRWPHSHTGRHSPPEAIRKIFDCLGLPSRALPIASAALDADVDELQISRAGATHQMLAPAAWRSYEKIPPSRHDSAVSYELVSFGAAGGS